MVRTRRPYQSPIREVQAAQTRERIVAAALELLERNDETSLTLPKVARSAGVSVPTVYVHFPTLDQLHLAVLDSLAARLRVSGGWIGNLAGLRDLPTRSFPLYARNRNALGALLASPAARHLARIWGPDLQPQWLASAREAAPGLTEGQCKARAALLSALWSPMHWLWLTETRGLSDEEAVESATWAIGVLVGALSGGEAVPSERDPRATDRNAGDSASEEPHLTPSWLL